MKKILSLSIITLIIVVAASCGGSSDSDKSTETATESGTSTDSDDDNPSYDPNRGEGKFTSLDLPSTLDATKAELGNQVSQVKCSSCHKMTDERLVGPGWAGVTTRRKPEWIMNFITNTDVMIDKDPEVQAQLELCLVRMPNQNLSDEDARNLLEYMRQNDGVK